MALCGFPKTTTGQPCRHRVTNQRRCGHHVNACLDCGFQADTLIHTWREHPQLHLVVLA